MEPEKEYTAAVLTDLQGQLLADQDGSYRRRVTGELETWEQELRQALQAGLPPGEYDDTRRLYQGIQTARQVLAACCRTDDRVA